MQFLTSATINLVGTNHISIETTAASGWHYVIDGGFNQLTFDGDGSLLIDYGQDTVSSTSFGSFHGIYANNGGLTFNGGEITVNMPDTSTFSNYAIYGSSGITINGGIINAESGTTSGTGTGFYSAYNVVITGGTVNVSGLGSSGGSTGIYSQSGSIRISGGKVTASNSSSSIVSAFTANVTQLPTTYSWTTSANSDGSIPTTGVFPGTAFVNDTAHRYINITAINTPPSLSISSPITDKWVNSLGNLTITGTITDTTPPASFSRRIGFSTTTTPPSEWTACSDTDTAAFSCTFAGSPTIAEGDLYLFASVNDGSGWVDTYIKVQVDKTPPTRPSISTDPELIQGEFTNAESIKIAINPGTDSGSGVQKTTYEIDGGDITTPETDYPGTPFTITPVGDGPVQVRVYTYDNAGNKSNNGASINFDRTPPTIFHSATGGTLISGTTYSAPPAVSLTATDPSNPFSSGISQTNYAWLSGAVVDTSCAFDTTSHGPDVIQTSVPTTPGTHTLCYRTTDNADNVSLTGTFTFTLVELTPTLSDQASGISVEHLGTGFTPDEYLEITELPTTAHDLSALGKDTLAIYTIQICSTNDNPCVPITSWPSGLRIKVPLGSFLTAHEDLSLIYINQAGTITPHPLALEGDYLVFETDHLSDWAILGTPKADSPTNAGSTDDSSNAPDTGFSSTSDDSFAESINIIALSTPIIAAIIFITIHHKRSQTKRS